MTLTYIFMALLMAGTSIALPGTSLNESTYVSVASEFTLPFEISQSNFVQLSIQSESGAVPSQVKMQSTLGDILLSTGTNSEIHIDFKAISSICIPDNPICIANLVLPAGPSRWTIKAIEGILQTVSSAFDIQTPDNANLYIGFNAVDDQYLAIVSVVSGITGGSITAGYAFKTAWSLNPGQPTEVMATKESDFILFNIKMQTGGILNISISAAAQNGSTASLPIAVIVLICVVSVFFFVIIGLLAQQIFVLTKLHLDMKGRSSNTLASQTMRKRSLPMYWRPSVFSRRRSVTARCCLFCLSPFDKDSRVELFPCGHDYHRDCKPEIATCKLCSKHSRDASVESVSMGRSIQDVPFYDLQLSKVTVMQTATD